MADPSDFEVDRDELADIFITAIRDLVFENAVPYPPGQRPVMVQLGGQLAAGKPTAMADIQSRYGVHVVELKSDTFRPYPPPARAGLELTDAGIALADGVPVVPGDYAVQNGQVLHIHAPNKRRAQ